MNDLTRTPKTRTVTDASGKSIVLAEPTPEKRAMVERIAETYSEALIRLADR